MIALFAYLEKKGHVMLCYRSNYEIVCKECNCKYVGETARSAYSRGLEHLKASKTGQGQAVMCKHACEKHGGKMLMLWT